MYLVDNLANFNRTEVKKLKMESTPKSQYTTDSECLDSSQFPLENSKTDESTPISVTSSRKRKAFYMESFPSLPNTPQFSSTLNESLMENLVNCHLQNDNLSRQLSKGKFQS